MEITAYTLPGCYHCKTLRELFKRAEANYTEVVVNRDITSKEFAELYPQINMFPFVVIDEEPVGGLVETVKLFVAKGLVSSSKKSG